MKLKIGEKIGYALGDTAANITWRTLTTFLLIFYTDVYGLSAAAAGVLLLVTRLTDGVTDVLMGLIADRTQTKFGKFRPWILWTSVPLAILMALTFTTPDLGETGKLVYAYVTYIMLMLAYTANNIPYSALMGVMTADESERTSLSSYRFAGAYFGGILTQGFLIYLVLFLGDGDQNKGYQYAIYLLSALMAILMLVTYFSTKERVKPVSEQKNDVRKDLIDLMSNKPWLVLLVVGFLFVTYNSIKQGMTVLYFKRILGEESLAASYMVTLLVISMVAALVTRPLSDRLGQKGLFIAVLLFSGVSNALIYFFGQDSVTALYVLGGISEFGAGIMPVLFFAMLGDAADYSEWKTGRRATGLVYSAGTFAMKFGGGMAGAVIGFLLSANNYDGMLQTTSGDAKWAIESLMSWVPGVIAVVTSLVVLIYPITKKLNTEISNELSVQRIKSEE